MKQRVTSIDFLRGLVMLLMALDHVRMFFGEGTWYAEPTNFASTTPLLFFTRWITHFCAPVFVFLAGTSAYLSGTRKSGTKDLSRFLLTRGLWLAFAELVIVNLAWTFDITYSFIIIQVIWVIGVSMVVLSALVFLPEKYILGFGLLLVFGHNMLDGVTVTGSSFLSLIWYNLHLPKFLVLDSGNVINFVYPSLPWIGFMALGYVFGRLYKGDFDPTLRRKLLLRIGLGATALFLFLRGFNLYGEAKTWSDQGNFFFSLMSFLNTTKYPPSLQFLLMTIGPAVIFLSLGEGNKSRIANLLVTLGRVPFFFYIIHLYLIHALASAYLAYLGQGWEAYVVSAREIMSGRLGRFGVRLEAVYVIWMIIILAMYPLCNWYQAYKDRNPKKRWLSYL